MSSSTIVYWIISFNRTTRFQRWYSMISPCLSNAISHKYKTKEHLAFTISHSMCKTMWISRIICKVNCLSKGTSPSKSYIKSIFACIDKLRISLVTSMEQMFHNIFCSFIRILFKHSFIFINKLIINHTIEYFLNS